MKNLFTVFCFLTSVSVISQTQISGIINNYAEVTAIDTCTATLTVSSTVGFVPDEQIIIIQMQGAKIDESNSSDFGDVTDLGSAGIYETATIGSVFGNEIQLKNYVLHDYDVTGAVQIATYPEYDNVQIIDTVRALPWNGSFGGIVALNITGELFFSAPIDVSGAGFRGGQAITSANPCTGGFNNGSRYFYEAGDWHGAAKGEGIAKHITGKEWGRGAQANGGGGGNDHNSGGGGGGNYTSGGIGGERETGFLTGACKGDNPGEAGKGTNLANDRIYFGGGAGAGHDNNDVATDGGNGGGIVIVSAFDVDGDASRKIIANGESVIEIAAGDGGGGGGGGGSIVVRIENLKNSLILEATGGQGGIVDNGNTDRSFGPGGGGSGGVIKELVINRINNSGTLNLLDGGVAGLTTNSTRGSNNTTNGAMRGGSGRKSSYGPIPEEIIPVGIPVFEEQPSPNVILCLGNTGFITANVVGKGLIYQWQIFDGTDFIDLEDGGNYTGTQTDSLAFLNPNTSLTGEMYRLVVVNICGEQAISQTSTVAIQNQTIADFNFVINGNEVQFINASLGASDYLWDFGSNSSSIEHPLIDFGMPGTYIVTLTASGSCGDVQKQDTVIILDNALPSADFSADSMSVCAPAIFQLRNLSSSNSQSFEWIFPGGNPSSSSDEHPIVNYNTPGNYDVILIATNANGRDTLIHSEFFNVRSNPTANFNFTIDNRTVTFQNTTIGGDNYAWDFGDNGTDFGNNPQHTYAEDGSYIVELTAENDCGIARISKTIIIGDVPTADFVSNKTGGCAPMQVTFTDFSSDNSNNRQWFFPGGTPSTSTDSIVKINYNTPGIYDVRLIVENSLTSDTLLSEDYIEVLPRPFAGFDYSETGATVTFNNTSTGAAEYTWDFGDGSSISNEKDPVHVFPGNGAYFVTLNALNEYCSSSITISVNITSTGTEESASGQDYFKIYPNPVSDFLIIETKFWDEKNFSGLILTDVSGRKLFTATEILEKTEIDVTTLTSGIYFIKLLSKKGDFVAKFVKIPK